MAADNWNPELEYFSSAFKYKDKWSVHLGRHLVKLLLLISTFFNSTSLASYESTLYLSLYLTTELRYISFWFSAAILEIMQLLLLILAYLNSASFTSYEWTLYSSLYLKAELRYTRFRISTAMLTGHHLEKKKIFLCPDFLTRINYLDFLCPDFLQRHCLEKFKIIQTMCYINVYPQ